MRDNRLMDKFEKRIIGSYYKNYRKRKKITIKEISALANLSEAAISEFENGKTRPSEETIRHIIKCYGTGFDLDISYLYERKRRLSELVELYCRYDLVKFNKHVEQIRSQKKLYDSFFYPLSLLCEYYQMISSEFELSEKMAPHMLADEINNCYDALFEDEKLLFGIFTYQHKYKESEYKAYHYLKSIYQAHLSSTSMLIPVTKYLLAYSEDIIKNYYEEIRLLEEATKLFIVNGYVLRALFCLNDLSLAYNNVFDYESAVQSAEKALRIAEQINDVEMFARVINNLSIIHHEKGEYEKAKEYADTLKEKQDFSLSAYSILVVANMRLGEIDLAKEKLCKLEQLNSIRNDEHYNHFIRVNRAKLYNKKGPHYFSALKAYLNYAIVNLPLTRSIRIYEDLIEYCKDNSMFEELMIYQNKIFECYKEIKK